MASNTQLEVPQDGRPCSENSQPLTPLSFTSQTSAQSGVSQQPLLSSKVVIHDGRDDEVYDYYRQAWLSVFGCVPLGILAVQAAKASRQAVSDKNQKLAKKKSMDALTYIILSFYGTLFLIVAIIVLTLKLAGVL